MLPTQTLPLPSPRAKSGSISTARSTTRADVGTAKQRVASLWRKTKRKPPGTKRLKAT